jgi:hypothetical protein
LAAKLAAAISVVAIASVLAAVRIRKRQLRQPDYDAAALSFPYPDVSQSRLEGLD